MILLLKIKITVLCFLLLFLFNCDKNPVQHEDSDEIILTPEDPNAPDIPDEWKKWINKNSILINSIENDCRTFY